jgi:hypothetical protein
LSADDKYEDNITACSGTGAMVCGVLRSIGIPARWIGVSQEQPWDRWDTEDGDEFLEYNEESAVGNGHRYNHVWLGDFYGWQRFDATPVKPEGNEFDKKPAEKSQWLLMQKSASGVESRRVIHTIQSEFWDKLHVPHVDCEEYVNTCGATRYNLLGSYTHPEDFNFSGNLIAYRAIQFINDVTFDPGNDLTGTVSWRLNGEWDLDPGARLMVVLEKKCEPGNENCPGFEEVAVLAGDIPCDQDSLRIDLGQYDPGLYRIKVIKSGDPSVGNAQVFRLPGPL